MADISRTAHRRGTGPRGGTAVAAVAALALAGLMALLPNLANGAVDEPRAGSAMGPSGRGNAAPVAPAAVLPGDNTSGGTELLQAVSADGRWVAFASEADDLVADDTNRTTDMFVRDRSTGTTIRIPWVTGRQLSRTLEAVEPTISADGSLVAFTVRPTTKASLIGRADSGGTVGLAVADGHPDAGIVLAATAAQAFPVVVEWNRSTNATTYASVVDGRPVAGSQPSISGDGAVLAWTAGGEVPHVVVRAGSAIGGIGTGASSHPSVSADGRFVALQADAGAGRTDVYRFDRSNGALILVSAVPAGQTAGGSSYAPSISGDGSVVAFVSTATNLTTDPGLDGTSQIYTWIADTGAIRLVSIDRTGAPGRGASSAPALSGDARFVAFDSVAPLLDTTVASATVSGPSASVGSAPPAPTLQQRDVFVHDLVNGETIRASLNDQGNESGGDSGGPSISGDGRVVAFDSTGPALLSGTANGFRQVFVREWTPTPTLLPDPLDFGAVVVGTRTGESIVTVSDLGWAPLDVSAAAITGPDAGDFALGTTDCPNRRLYFRDECRIGITFAPGALGQRFAELQVPTSAGGSAVTTRIVGTGIATATSSVPGGTATPTPPTSSVPPSLPQPGGGVLGTDSANPMLILDPPLGPPGFVTTAIGSGFPPGADVRLTWDRGITASSPPIHVGVDGMFRVGVLILPKSELGPRSLVATGVGGPGFGSVSAPFLVVIGSAQPPASGAVEFVAPSIGPIIDRR